MKTILYMATSITGKITSGLDDTSWVQESDVARMDALMLESGVMIMGKNTYDSFGDELPTGPVLLVVMTHDQKLLAKTGDSLIFTDSPPVEILQVIEEKGYKQALLAGGESLNSSFLKANLIDEIRIILKPLIIGTGKSLFNLTDHDQKLKLISTTPLPDDSLELKYSVTPRDSNQA